MPIHDWSRIDPGTFHNFHQIWSVELANRLNAKALPDGFFAMIEQKVPLPEPDVVTLSTAAPRDLPRGGIATLTRPEAKIVERAEDDYYVRKANRIAIHHGRGRIVAVVEFVSPGNKHSVTAFSGFVRKAGDFLRAGVHLLIVDLFPPTRRDPNGVHEAIWSEISPTEYQQPADAPLTAVSYFAGSEPAAFVEPLALGQSLPPLPLFLGSDELEYVPCPLEETYQSTWASLPQVLRDAVENEAGEE